MLTVQEITDNRLLLPMMSAHAFSVTQGNVTLSYEDADNQLFGTPSVSGSGNTIAFAFTPDNFVAESTNGAGVTSVFDILNMDIDVAPGYQITKLSLVESGDYQLSADYGSANAPQVQSRGLWAITSNTTVDANGTGDLGAGFSFRKANLFDTGILTGETSSSSWSINSVVDLGSVADWGSDTSVTATLENHLNAWSFDNAELANIAKKIGGVSVEVEIQPVPVPAAVWLLGSGLMGLLSFGRKNHND